MSTEVILGVGISIFALALVALGIFRGLVKLLCWTISLSLGGVIGWVLHIQGFSYLSFVTSQPKSWMCLTLSIVGGIGAFLFLNHALSWFASLLGFGSENKFFGLKGGMTTIVMTLIMGWCVLMAVRYRGSISELEIVHKAANEGKLSSDRPVMKRCKDSLDKSKWGPVLVKIDPFDDPMRLKLAKCVVWLAAQEENKAMSIRSSWEKEFYGADKIWRLSRDPGILSLVKQEDLGGILSDKKLSTYLADGKRLEAFQKYDLDKVLKNGGTAKLKK